MCHLLRFVQPALLLSAALAAAGCEKMGTAPPGAADQPGFAVYARVCVTCHGNDGSSTRASRIARERIDLRDLVAGGRRPDGSRIADVVRRGKGGMEGFGAKLTDSEITAVSSYVVWLAAAADAATER